MKQTKLDESYTSLEADPQTLKEVADFLKVERPGAFIEPAVKSGFKSPYHYFTRVLSGKLIVMNGHLSLLKRWGVQDYSTVSDFTNEDFDEFYSNIKETFPFEPYDYQVKAAKESIVSGKQINLACTGCLDGDSEIDIECDDYTYEQLKEFLK